MSRHKCGAKLYQAFLAGTSVRYSGLALSEVSPVRFAHDSATNMLKQITLRPRELFKKTAPLIDQGARNALVFDDAVMNKSRSEKIALVRRQYSGNGHRIIRGIGVVNALVANIEKKDGLPVDFRVYAPDEDGKSKNRHFRDMLKSFTSKNINIEVTIADCWYSSLKNLKAVKDHNMEWVMGIHKNRKVRFNGQLMRVDQLNIPHEGLPVHLPGYGRITVFWFETNKQSHRRFYGTSLVSPSRQVVKEYVDARWSVEVFHREIKQTCGIERCQARSSRAQRNHILLAMLAWTDLRQMRCSQATSSYQVKWNSIKSAVSQFISTFLRGHSWSTV